MAHSAINESLQGKITKAYIALVMAILFVGFVAVFDLVFLERQIAEGKVVTDLKDAMLEMRREEKNLFLYGDAEAFVGVRRHAERIKKVVGERRDSLSAILSSEDVARLEEWLGGYLQSLDQWQAKQSHAVQRDIRKRGQRISLLLEDLSDRERRILEAAARQSQWLLFISLLIIGLSILFVGRWLRRLVVSPLKELEHRLQAIAEGRFTQMQPFSGDREFLAFAEAFNRMLRELEVRQKRMLQSEKLASLGILAAGVAHELNNPLSNISSSCQLLLEELEEADPAQLRRWLEQIDQETERGRRIIRTLLDFGSQRAFERRKHGLHSLVEESLSILGKSLSRQDAQVVLNIPKTLEVEVDRQRMLQLFINLIQNALHAGGNGVQVRISALTVGQGASLIPDDAQVAGNLNCATDREGACVEILVSDNGPGISSDLLSRVLDPFFTTGEPGRGFGLGLYIVQEIVSEHDGCLAIVSKPGRGTQVIILLPMEDPHDSKG